MVVVPLASSANDPEAPSAARSIEPYNWVRVAAAGALAASGVLLMGGKRRAGLAVAAAGTTLAILDQKETVRVWWNRLPGYLADAQDILARVQGTVDELTRQGEKLRQTMSK